VERHLRPIHPIIERANAAFPNLEVELGDAQLDRSIISRRIGRYAMTQLKLPAVAVELSGKRAAAAGLGNHLKLMWQLAGRMRYESSSRKFDIAPGDLVVTSMADDYRLEMLEGHEAEHALVGANAAPFKRNRRAVGGGRSHRLSEKQKTRAHRGGERPWRT
jgi:hypothetical protein